MLTDISVASYIGAKDLQRSLVGSGGSEAERRPGLHYRLLILHFYKKKLIKITTHMDTFAPFRLHHEKCPCVIFFRQKGPFLG